MPGMTYKSQDFGNFWRPFEENSKILEQKKLDPTELGGNLKSIVNMKSQLTLKKNFNWSMSPER